MCATDFDEPSFLTERWVTSKKGWRCYECGNLFAVGSRSLVITGKWDGRVIRFRHCARCDEIGHLVSVTECSYLFGDLYSSVEQVLDPYGWHAEADPAVLGRLAGLMWLRNEERYK